MESNETNLNEQEGVNSPYQVFTVIFSTIVFILGAVAGFMFPTLMEESFNLTLMLVIWFFNIIITYFMYAIGAIIFELRKLNLKK